MAPLLLPSWGVIVVAFGPLGGDAGLEVHVKVQDIMTSPVLSVRPSTPIVDAAQLMLAHRISGLPVVDDSGALVGVVTEGDFLKRTELGTEPKRSGWLHVFLSAGRAADEYVHSHGRRVEDVMTRDIVVTPSSASLEEVVEAMGRRHIKRLPVVDGGQLVGIVSRSDILKALANRLATASAPDASDESLRKAIVAELGGQFWSGNGLIRVDVEGGKATLSGTIFDERERDAARVCAENVPGVQAVEDQLVCVEPISGVIIMPPQQREN